MWQFWALTTYLFSQNFIFSMALFCQINLIFFLKEHFHKEILHNTFLKCNSNKVELNEIF